MKQEPVDLDYSAQHSVIPSVGPASVWEGDFTSVQMASVDPATPLEIIGDPEGSKTLQFFYQSPLEDIKIGFPPVRVKTDDEVNCVVALVTEKAEDFNRSEIIYFYRHFLKGLFVFKGGTIWPARTSLCNTTAVQ